MAEQVRIENQTRGTVLADRCRLARSTRERSVGLLATPELRPGEGLLIERSPSIHMFFMRYAIDAVFVDRHLRVRRVVEDLRPWRIVLWAWGARDCIELPVGAVRSSSTRAGDQLTIAPAAAAHES